MKRLKLLLAAVLAVPFVAAGVASAEVNPRAAFCEGADTLQISRETNTGTPCVGMAGDNAEAGVNALIEDVINIFSIIVGIVAVIMIIVGGFKYITSGGDSGNVTGAKNTILYAIIGLIVVALAQLIVRFVIETSVEAVDGAGMMTP